MKKSKYIKINHSSVSGLSAVFPCHATTCKRVKIILIGNFEKNPKRFKGPVLWAWLEMFFIPSEVPILTSHNISRLIFQLNTLKGDTKAPAKELFRLNTLRGTNTGFLTPRPFYMGVPLPPPPPPPRPREKAGYDFLAVSFSEPASYYWFYGKCRHALCKCDSEAVQCFKAAEFNTSLMNYPRDKC